MCPATIGDLLGLLARRAPISPSPCLPICYPCLVPWTRRGCLRSKKAGGSFLESGGVHNARSQALKRNVVPISQCMREIVRGKCGTLRGQRVYPKDIALAKKRDGSVRDCRRFAALCQSVGLCSQYWFREAASLAG